MNIPETYRMITCIVVRGIKDAPQTVIRPSIITIGEALKMRVKAWKMKLQLSMELNNLMTSLDSYSRTQAHPNQTINWLQR